MFGLLGEQRAAGCTEFGPRSLAELGELLGCSALGLGVTAGASCAVAFLAPVDIDEERTLVYELLGRAAAAIAGDVTSRHRDEMRGDTEVLQCLGDAHRPEHVDFDRAVERGVERDRGRRMEHGVARRQRGAAFVIESEPIGADVAGNGPDTPGRHLGEALFAQVGAQPVEGVVLQDLPLHSLVDRRTLARPDEQDDLAVRHRSQQALEHGGAQEAGGAGEEEPLASQRFTNHALLSTIW